VRLKNDFTAISSQIPQFALFAHLSASRIGTTRDFAVRLLSMIWSGPMNARRGFLRALGMGGIYLGFPGAVQAFGRRRRCAPSPCVNTAAICPSCGVPPVSFPYQSEDTRPACPTACIVSYYGQSNGLFYYYCQCCGDGFVTVSSTTYYSPPYATCPGSGGGCITSLVPVDPNPGPIGLSGVRVAEVRFPLMYFSSDEYTNGVWAINDDDSPFRDPLSFFPNKAGGAQENGAAVDVRYNIGTPSMVNYLHARIHEIAMTGKPTLYIAHPYDPNKPNFPKSFVDYTHKGNSRKHDVIETPDKKKRFHVHRLK
jgi:hypothetical protein